MIVEAVLGILSALIITLGLIALAAVLGKLASKFSRYKDIN